MKKHTRRHVLSSLGALAVTTAVPVAAAKAAAKPTPFEEMKALIQELRTVAKEFDPNIADWHIVLFGENERPDLGCRVLISGFHDLKV